MSDDLDPVPTEYQRMCAEIGRLRADLAVAEANLNIAKANLHSERIINERLRALILDACTVFEHYDLPEHALHYRRALEPKP